jgi:hypothetical protein
MTGFLGLCAWCVCVLLAMVFYAVLHVSAEHDAAREVSPTLHPERAVRTIRRGELGRSVKVDLNRGKVKP